MCDRARRQKRVSACFFRRACAVPFALARRRARPVLWRTVCLPAVAARRRHPRSARALVPSLLNFDTKVVVLATTSDRFRADAGVCPINP